MASSVPSHVAFKFSVEFQARDGGGLCAFSDDVPGFVLSHPDCELVLADVEPVLETILSEMYNATIRVTPCLDVRSYLENAGLVDPVPASDPFGTREYVYQIAA